MIAPDLSATIKQQIADEVQVAEASSDRVLLYAPFSHDDGDSLSLLFVKESAGDWKLTDDGDVLLHVGYGDVDLLAPGRVERFRRVIGAYGLTEAAGKLSLEVDRENFGEAFYRFSQACFEVARLAKFPPQKERTQQPQRLGQKLESIIKTTVKDASAIERKWHHPTLDPNTIYDVDYRIPAKRGDVLVFTCATIAEGWRKTASCLHYRQSKHPFAGLAVFPEDAAMLEGPRTAMVDADAKAVSVEDEDEIRDFLAKKAG